MSTENLNTNGSISVKEAAVLIEGFRNDRKLDDAPCFFIPLHLIQKFFGIPNLQGITVYIGKKPKEDVKENQAQEILFLIGTTKIGEEYYDVFNYNFTINNGDFAEKDFIEAPATSRQPCPPPVPPATKCSKNKVFNKQKLY